MTIRQQLEAREAQFLAPWAARSAECDVREMPISPDDLRTAFQRDRDRLIHAKAFRRLKHKTQCFINPSTDHIRTRLTHTLEVSQIARTLARSLRLNEDLAEAIALGHDLGHTPFGHMGERILDGLMPGGFKHRAQSLRVVTVLENYGKGLNLTAAVRDGILHHSGATPPATLEGQCVSRADRIAYINHDIDDSISAGVLTEDDLPRALTGVLGTSHGERINTMILDVVRTSGDGQGVRMSGEIGAATLEMRQFLYDNVYQRDAVAQEEEKASRMLLALFSYAMENPHIIPAGYAASRETDGTQRAVCDWIAGMTDRYAIRLFREIFMPSAFTTELF